MGISRLWLLIGSIVMIGIVWSSLKLLAYLGITNYIAKTIAVLLAVLAGCTIMLSSKVNPRP